MPALPYRLASLALLPLLVISGLGLLARPAAAEPPSNVLDYENFQVPPAWVQYTTGLGCSPGWDSATQTYTMLLETPWCGSVLASNRQLTSKCWEAEFRYRFLDNPTGNDPSNTHGDGLVFDFYKRMPDFALGPDPGGFIAFTTGGGTPVPGYGVEIDTWGGNVNDPGGAHVALIKDSTITHLGTSIYQTSGATDFTYNAWHQARIQWVDYGRGVHLDVWIDQDSSAFGIPYTPLVDINLPPPPATDYYITGYGFSAATGGAMDQVNIDDFVLRDLCTPGWCGASGYDGITKTESFRTNPAPRWNAFSNGAGANVWQSADQEYSLTTGVSQGALLESKHPLDNPDQRWEAEFRYQMGADGHTPFGDGMVFQFYKNTAPLATPGTGGTLGFEPAGGGPAKGYGVELDTVSNSWDPPVEHVSVLMDRSTTTAGHLGFSPQPLLRDGISHQMRITYITGTVYIHIDNQLIYAVVVPPPGFTGLGFSAGTGAYWDDHRIDDFTLRECVALASSPVCVPEAGVCPPLPTVPSYCVDALGQQVACTRPLSPPPPPGGAEVAATPRAGGA
jgi:hypothetical protein